MEENKSSNEQQAAPTNSPVTPAAGNGLAIAAMVIGIVALIGGLIPFWGFLLGVTALILGIVGLKKKSNTGMSVTGIVTGGIAVIWGAFIAISFMTILAGATLIGDSINQEIQRQDDTIQSQVDSKKDFKKGETAILADKFELKVNSVNLNYTPKDEWLAATEGKQYVVVNVTVKNIGDETEYFSGGDLALNEEGVSSSMSFVDVEPAFGYGDISPGASKTGNLAFEVNEGASNLKLQYSTSVYSLKDGAKKLTYTLAI